MQLHFFLTTPFLGLMYYFVPKAAERPVYSYRLSIIHFWSLIFLYIWSGPHHLLNSSLPDWAQTMGDCFFNSFDCTIVGWDDQRASNAKGRMGSFKNRSSIEVYGGWDHVLRDVYF